MLAFVTVGSTRFDGLVQRALSDNVLNTLRSKGYDHLVVQCGHSDFDASGFTKAGDTWTRRQEGGVLVEVWRFKSSLQEEYKRADLVISHAGVYTVLSVLCHSHGNRVQGPAPFLTSCGYKSLLS